MARKGYIPKGLDYLQNRPKTVWWKVIAGPPGFKLSILQDHDLVFDNHDCKIRQISEMF